MVAAGADRYLKPLQVGTDVSVVKVSGRDTGGGFALFEYAGYREGGPPLHLHRDQDEIFVVREGRYLFQCGDDRTALQAGDTIFLPRGIPHSFRQTSPTGRLQFMFTPAGDMEAFFTALAQQDGPPSPEVASALFAAHGMKVVGPPIEGD
jgi:quercetin 2,3-dioxygenase